MEVTLANSLEEKLSRIAAREGRDSNAIIVEAVERMLEHDEWFKAEVQKGLAQVESGQTLSHEEVGARLGRLMASKQTRV